jgi:pyruvate ferredoxin oxidoreductase alpha subunit
MTVTSEQSRRSSPAATGYHAAAVHEFHTPASVERLGGPPERRRGEPSLAVARAVGRSRALVVCPPGDAPTAISQAVSGLKRADDPDLRGVDVVSSDTDVIATAIEVCAPGRRVYTTTDGEGLLGMAQSLFRASQLAVPIVMTVTGRAGTGTGEGRRDHAHAMALRDCGWIQLYPSDEQDTIDVHVQAFLIAQSLSLPVMVCTDEFTRARGNPSPQVPSSSAIDSFLDGWDRPGGADRPDTGSGESPATHMEMRYRAHTKLLAALKTIRQVGADFHVRFGRQSGGLLASRDLWGARIAVLGLGSAFEAIDDTVEALRPKGVSVGSVALRSFRPFPAQDLAAAVGHCEHLVVVERAVAIGIGGIVSTDVRSGLARLPVQIHTVIAGLGERAIGPASLQRLVYKAAHGNLEELSFLDVDHRTVLGPR